MSIFITDEFYLVSFGNNLFLDMPACQCKESINLNEHLCNILPFESVNIL